MAASYYFYDLETSGRFPRYDRIMQFAGQRTDLNFKPIGKSDNLIIKLTPDVLPEADAILTHGITPQQSLAEGITEAEFLKYFFKTVVKPNTTFVGFNNIRFDDEFMRFTLWRNYYDAYEWQWKDGNSRWDLQDIVRLTRALRPDGIEWPKVDAQNRLEVLAKLNKLEHGNAHDALSDVNALIELTKLIQTKQPKLYNYAFNLRSKAKLEPFIKSGKPFVYTSGRYPKESMHTTVAIGIADNPQKQSAFVYDLRVDPEPFLKLSVDELAELWRYKSWKTQEDRPAYFPVKDVAFNKCPAVAPLGVLDKASQSRLQIDLDQIKQNLNKLQTAKGFGDRLAKAWTKLYERDKQPPVNELTVDSQLYDGFVSNADKIKMSAVRAASANEINDVASQFEDQRLKLLAPLYKARNYPSDLNSEEQVAWETFCKSKLTEGGETSRLAKVYKRIAELEKTATKNQTYLLEELSLYGQSIVPIE